MLVKSINPATLEINKTFTTVSKTQAFAAIKKSKEAFSEWKNLDLAERTDLTRKLAFALRKNKDAYARLMTMEMGKPIKQSLAEVEKCAWTADVYADSAANWLEEERVSAGGKKHLVTFEPLGTILSIMPWNFPFWQAMRFAIPALTAGNVSILRHSNTVPMCSLAIAETFTSAGFPAGVFQSLITDYPTANAMIPRVDGVSLTGSTGAGAKVAALAGANLKKFVLELGGSDPFIVLEDADVSAAARAAVDARVINSGQSCIAAKRFIVAKKVADQFTEKFVQFHKSLKVGNPMHPDTDVGPLANAEQLKKLQVQLKDAVRKGAKVLVGGSRLPLKGHFFEPTVLANIKPTMKVFSEEVFGPVAPIVVVKDEFEAIHMANASEYGLGASIWTKDIDKGERIARRLQAGCVFVNNVVKSDPRMPFGGVKRSGIGRELSHYGLKEFVNVKGINLY